MRFHKDVNKVFISADELSAYAFVKENHKRLAQKFGFSLETSSVLKDPAVKEYDISDERDFFIRRILECDTEYSNAEVINKNVPLEIQSDIKETTVTVDGYADIVSSSENIHTIEEIKVLRKKRKRSDPFSDPSLFAKACVFAYITAKKNGEDKARIKLSYIKASDGTKYTYKSFFSFSSLERFFYSLINRAERFILLYAKRCSILPEEIKKMPFPYPSIREGQTEFINAVYKSIKKNGRLMVSAPTGTGKTMSALFPAVRAIGDGAADKIFYLTAKGVTGKAAADALRDLSEYVPDLHSVIISAKEQICPIKKVDPSVNLQLCCPSCEKSDSIYSEANGTFVSYKERELDALEKLLTSGNNIYTPGRIVETAREYNVCPYELSLDLSENCSVIICDYNYVIDDKIRLKRYFKNPENIEKKVFLFDEAHNLPDRTRDIYSSSLSLETAENINDFALSMLAEDKGLTNAASIFIEQMRKIASLCVEDEYLKKTENGEIKCGFFENSSIPKGFASSVGNLCMSLGRYIKSNHELSDSISQFYKELSKAAFSISFFNDKFRFFAKKEGENVTASIICVDPSEIIDQMIKSAVATVMFSATLSPIDYFSELCGMKRAEKLELESPYTSENLCLIAYDSLSTRLADRKKTSVSCADIIAEAISVKEGNYIVYFPSYDYMKRVCRAFVNLMPESVNIVMQRPEMTIRERERFIELFHDRSKGNIVGFCVLGGIFSEGVDLVGESLIGAVIVGCGMPMLSPERNIIADYYNKKDENGNAFAYVCPGMNKVLQAAGRVIRSENDRGMILLIDDRLSDPSMKLLFPKHWHHMKYTGNIESLTKILDDFWNEK